MRKNKQNKNMLHNSKGAASVEFVFIFPILLAVFFGMLEYSRVIYHTQKANKVSSTLADMFSMFKPVDHTKSNEELQADCTTEHLMITDKRIRGILSQTVVNSLLLPIGSDKVSIHISSVYKTDNQLPKVVWKYDYQTNPNLSFPSSIGDVGENANLPEVNGIPGGMFNGENILVVETAIEYNSIIDGIADFLMPSYSSGLIVQRIYYPIRNYLYDNNGMPAVGLNYIWPINIPNGGSSANPNNC